MTGAYVRVGRNGKWESVEIEHLTDAERRAFFEDKKPEEIVRWLNALCNHLQLIENLLQGCHETLQPRQFFECGGGNDQEVIDLVESLEIILNKQEK